MDGHHLDDTSIPFLTTLDYVNRLGHISEEEATTRIFC